MDVNHDGCAIVTSILDPQWIHELTQALHRRSGGPSNDLRPHAQRNLLRLAIVRRLADSPQVRSIVQPVLGPSARPVRGLLFDKTPAANWKVPWHQDLAIPVERKCDLPGFGPWSGKAGIVHVQPPAAVLEQMLTVRIHLDDCPADNGPLRVIPGSHRLGILSDTAIAAITAQADPKTLCVCAGGAVIMRPLLLHASSAALAPRRRRVIHLEFAGIDLPPPLKWRPA
jgi:ectoine hydroxylase-related dioxygenase (phytanoyl-CoA dioxygenase family)